MADTDKKQTDNEEIPQSAAARIMHGLGEDQEQRPEIPVEKVSFLENFWYHHKWKTIAVVFVAIVVCVCVAQMNARETPDVYILYAGPYGFAQNEVFNIRDAMRQVMEDYNGDGERGIAFSDFFYLNEKQIEQARAEAEAAGVTFYMDMMQNSQTLERFELEVFGGESVICILDPALYEQVKSAGGLLPLSEIFESAPDTAVDAYGIRLADTEFARYFSSMQVLPEDSVLCIRRVSTMSVFKGQKKTEQVHQYHVSMFRSLVEFTFPEGYVESSAS